MNEWNGTPDIETLQSPLYMTDVCINQIFI